MINIKDLNVVSENELEIWAFCPKHNDKKRGNFYITKDNQLGHCFACGYTTKVNGLGKVKMKLKDRPISINWNSLVKLYKKNIVESYDWVFLSKKWDVKPFVLNQLNCGWDRESFTFPVYSEDLQVVGIQRIYPNGDKRLVKGSRIGIFISTDANWTEPIIITEGIHDLATVLDLGFNTVGRLSATCGGEILTKLIKDTTVTIIADNDKIGIESAKKLATQLTKQNQCDIIIPDDGKDISDWVKIKGKQWIKKYLRNI